MAEIEIMKEGLKQINLSGAVAKGMNCVVKAIIKGKALMVVLADDCDNKEYKNLIMALCKKHNVKLEMGINKADLGTTLGLVYMKADGSMNRSKGCASCAVTKIGKIRTAHVDAFVEAYLPEKSE